MLYTKFQPQSFLGSWEENFKLFFFFTILFNGAEPFEQIDNTPSTEGSMWNLMKNGHAVSENTEKDYTILHMYIGQGQGQLAPRDKILIVIKRVCYFDHTL